MNSYKRESVMKKLITTAFVMLLLLTVGCSDQTSVTSPEQSVQAQEPNWITLPQSSSSGLHINTEWTTTERINGAQGGFLTNSVSYLGGILGTVYINARIDFPQGSYPGNENITLTLSDQNTSVKFGPAMDKFNRTVVYNVKYRGLNLNGINPATVKFAFIANDGSIQYANCDRINVDVTNGILEVVNAVIPHFSRYGFVN
jgi:hypothetical protein